MNRAPGLAKHIEQDPLRDLPLAAPSPAPWVEAAAADIDATLADHAHCELKAASTALSMAGRFPEATALVRDLTALAHEDIRHFERVVDLVQSRGQSLPKVGPDRYVKGLRNLRLPKLPGSSALMDQLVLCGFIEARSCERFRLLARGPIPGDLRGFYAELAGAEARHHELFFEHARRVAGPAVAEMRIRQVAELEAALIRDLPLASRIH